MGETLLDERINGDSSIFPETTRPSALIRRGDAFDLDQEFGEREAADEQQRVRRFVLAEEGFPDLAHFGRVLAADQKRGQLHQIIDAYAGVIPARGPG